MNNGASCSRAVLVLAGVRHSQGSAASPGPQVALTCRMMSFLPLSPAAMGRAEAIARLQVLVLSESLYRVTFSESLSKGAI